MMRKRWMVLGALVLAALVLIEQHWRVWLSERFETGIRYLYGLGVWGLIATAGLQFLVAASGILPASLLGVAAGAAYGLVTGFLLAACGVMAGALAAFWASRSFLRPLILRYLQHRKGWHSFDRRIGADGWGFVCLIRLSPVMPFAVASYTLGISSIRLGDYMLGTLASLPALLLYVFLGTLAHAGLENPRDPWTMFLVVVGAVATIALAWRIGKMALEVTREEEG